MASAAAATTAESVLDLGWGTAVVVTGLGQPGPASTFRAAGPSGPGLQASPTTLTVSVDALAEAAQAHGYTCTTPEVTTIRGCQRTVDGYHDDLWLQGTDTFTTSVDLSVTSDYRTATRARWVELMDQTLGWVDTAQTRSVRTWLAASADAPGAQAYVDGLPSPSTPASTSTPRRTFGGISAEAPRQSTTSPPAPPDPSVASGRAASPSRAAESGEPGPSLVGRRRYALSAPTSGLTDENPAVVGKGTQAALRQTFKPAVVGKRTRAALGRRSSRPWSEPQAREHARFRSVYSDRWRAAEQRVTISASG